MVLAKHQTELEYLETIKMTLSHYEPDAINFNHIRDINYQ